MSERINIGDTVDVHFATSESLFECIVLYMPAATGDSWILQDTEGNVFYVQIFERMDKRRI